MQLTRNQLTRRAKEMREFADLVQKVYVSAEGQEKNVFNATRKHLYELKDKARNLAHKWERQASQPEMF